MKILHVITSLQYGGAEKLVAEIATMIRDKGHHVDVLVFNSTEPNFFHILLKNGIKIHTCGNNANVYNPLYIFKLVKLISYERYDIIHTHNTSPQYFAAISSLFCKGTRYVTTEHNTYNRRRSIPIFKGLDRWMYSRYQQIICISDQAEINMRHYLPTTKNIRTIYNGINISKFHSALPKCNLVTNGKIVVIMVAAFRKQKDQKTLIRAFTHLPIDKFELWLVGNGEKREEVEVYAKSLGFPENTICFLGNRLDVPELLQSADIVVMSSHYEGLSLSSVEGMSVGKPFVASDVDGLREVVEGYGVLFPHEDDRALADIIRKLSEDDNYYRQVADKCWERAQMYDIRYMIDSYCKIYEDII